MDSPKVAAAKRRGQIEDPVAIELALLEQRLRELEATTRLLLALRIEKDGHAKNLGQAIRIARDLDRVRALYPEAF